MKKKPRRAVKWSAKVPARYAVAELHPGPGTKFFKSKLYAYVYSPVSGVMRKHSVKDPNNFETFRVRPGREFRTMKEILNATWRKK